MNIPFNDLKRGFDLFKSEYEKKVIEVLNSGRYILGNEVLEFEKEFANRIGSKYVIGVDNGLNAISLGIKALNFSEGDEILVQANTYIATMLGVSHNCNKIIAIEPDAYYNIDSTRIAEKLTQNTKAVLITHMYGQPSNMDKICDICDKHELTLLEDCAQAHFSKYKDRYVGTFGEMGFFSFYPTKNLGAFGDAGAIITNNDLLAEKLFALRNYGSNLKYHNQYIGYNSRMDEIQAGLLRIKLKYIKDLNSERSKIAERYLNEIKNPWINLPAVLKEAKPTWHLFIIRTERRDQLKIFLAEHGINTDIHYPVPPHLSQAYHGEDWAHDLFPITEMYACQMLSLPLFNGMTEEEIDYIIHTINLFQGE